MAHLRRGEGKHAVRLFYQAMAGAMSARNAGVAGESGSTGLNRKEALALLADEAACLSILRHMLVCEAKDGLDLLTGVPAAWLAGGARISIRRMPTWFGPLDFQVQSVGQAKQLLVRISGLRRGWPAQIRLSIPLGRIRGVSVGGRPISTFDSARGIITFDGPIDHEDIVVSY